MGDGGARTVLARVLLAAATSCTRAPAGSIASTNDDCTGESALDVLGYTVDLSLQTEPPALTGRGEVRVRLRRAAKELALDAHQLRFTDVSTASGPLAFHTTGDRLCAELPNRLPAGTVVDVRLGWEVPATGDTPHVSPHEVWAGYRASAWMPTLQDPAQRATLSLRLHVPPNWKIAASGASVGEAVEPPDRVVHAFALERPSPPFLYAFAAGQFEEATLVVDGVRLRALGPPGADLPGVLAATGEMMRLLRRRTGAPFPASEYAQVFVHGDIAQEGAGLALFSADVLDDLKRDPTDDWPLSHELAHQWFAWLVPCADFSDFWLNEGFATYLVGVVKEERWGRAAYERERAVWRSRSAKVHADGRDAPIALSNPEGTATRPPREGELQPRGVTYFRGALLLDRLRSELGDDAFWRGIQRYVEAAAGRGARTEDLRAALEAASGQDLKGFFETWVYRAVGGL
jgi:aminopeptidase N